VWPYLVSDVISGLALLASAAALALLSTRTRRLRRALLIGSVILGASGLAYGLDAWAWLRPSTGLLSGTLRIGATAASLAAMGLLAPCVPRMIELVEARAIAMGSEEDALSRTRRELVSALESARVARDHAESASRIKVSFLRMVSHELCTPLTALKLNLERLRRDREGALSERQRDILRRMKASSDRLLELIESLLEYARIESGRLSVVVEPCDLAGLAGDVLEELSEQAMAKGIALSLRVRGALPPLWSDGRLLRLVLLNLVGNAVKFTERGGVEIAMGFAGGEHWVRVRDSGPGIPPEARERIFEPFEQMEPIWNKHTRGVGLGLAIVRDTVGALGGRIDLSSRVGVGTTFTVTLPALEAEGKDRLTVHHAPLDASHS